MTKAGREEKDHHEDIGLEELKALFRAARRESRDQASEIRELEKQNHRLQEAYNKIRAEFAEDPRRFTKVERNRYVEHFQLMENHIHWQEHEQTKLKSHIEMLTKQTRDANGEREDLEGNNRKLQKQIQDLQSSLTECKDDLLRMQPSNQIADSEIGDRYSNLAQQITSWVDDQTEDSEALEERFSSVSRGGLEIDPILNMYIENRHVKLIQDHPDALPLVVQYLIHRCLEQYVMGNGIYFYGLDIRNIGLLQEVEAGMKLLEPRRGKHETLSCQSKSDDIDGVTLRRWRSETLAGLSRSKDFATARQQQGQTLAKTLYFALARLLRGPKMQVNDEGWEELHKQIILPAIELATAMRLSTTDYEVVSRNGGDRDDQVIVHHNEIPHYQMVDNASHKIVRPDSALRLGEEGRIGTELLTVTPALMRTKNDGVHRVVISKPTILVKLDEPMGKRSKGSRPFGAWTPNWFGGDSTVE